MSRILVHICCGPCATRVIEALLPDHSITGFFHNPNIFPADEHMRRLEAARTVCGRFGVDLIEEPPDYGAFIGAVRGLESEPENGARCSVCYRLRLGRTMDAAVRGSFEFAATTLTVGPRKKASVIDPIGMEEAEKRSIRFWGGDWKKNDGFRRSCELAREFGLYRQRWCGCEYSIRNDAAGKSMD